MVRSRTGVQREGPPEMSEHEHESDASAEPADRERDQEARPNADEAMGDAAADTAKTPEADEEAG